MLLNDGQIALNEVIIALKDAASRYNDAADVTHDFGLVTLFQAIERKHRHMAEELEEHIRQTGALPREPDADRETLAGLFTRLKTMLSGDEQLTLLQEQARAEEEIAARIGEAIAESLPDETLSLLRQFHGDVSATRQHLAAVAARLSKD